MGGHPDDGIADNQITSNNIKEDEEEILRSSQPALSWMKAALSPLLAAAASTDIDVFLASSASLGEEVLLDSGILEDREKSAQPCDYGGCKQAVGRARFSCPACAKIYCSAHAGHPSFEVRVESSATYQRICLKCWLARPENKTELGATRNWMSRFEHLRRETIAAATALRSLLESRLSQLLTIEESQVADKRAMQQLVVPWQPDSSSPTCPYCKEPFSATSLRRHHCRLCGSLVCGSCKHAVTMHEIIVCPSCNSGLGQAGEILNVRPVDPLRLHYQALLSSREQVMQNLPTFNSYLDALEQEFLQMTRNQGRIHAIRMDASAVRDTLFLIFDHYEAALKQISACKDGKSVQRDLVIRNIEYAGMQFLKLNRFSLKKLPGGSAFYEEEIAIPATKQEIKPPESLVSSLTHRFLPFTRPTEHSEDTQVPLPVNLGALMQRLEVMHEQRSQLEGFLEDARINRRFADFASLEASLGEIEAEIDLVKAMCSINR